MKISQPFFNKSSYYLHIKCVSFKSKNRTYAILPGGLEKANVWHAFIYFACVRVMVSLFTGLDSNISDNLMYSALPYHYTDINALLTYIVNGRLLYLPIRRDICLIL